MLPSVALRVALRPFRTYGKLGQGPQPGLLARGLATWLLSVACVVSWTTSGALLVEHLLLNPLVCLFAPLVHAAWLVAVTRACGLRRGREVIALYYQGHLPWLALLMLVAGVCLIAPDPAGVFWWAIEHHVLVALALVATAWCGILTYALFRAGLALPRRTSAVATAAFYLGYGGTLASWFVVTGQLLPLWGLM